MKKLFVILFILGANSILFAQNSNQNDDLINILVKIKEVEVFKQCENLKNTIEQQTQEVYQNPLASHQQKTSLQTAYQRVWQKYDFFLKAVKQDLIDNKKLEKLWSNPQATAQNYALLCNEVKHVYNNSYLPVYQAVPQQGKSIPVTDLVSLGIDAFQQIVVRIQARKQQKTEHLNQVLPLVNEYFEQSLRMKLWSELNLQATETAVNNQTPDAMVVPAPTLSSLLGSVEFVQILNKQELAMNFEAAKGKNIELVEDTISTHYFSTTTTYPIGTRFKLKATSDAFVYVLALNTDGIKLLFPLTQYKQLGKNIEVIEEANPETGLVILPTKGYFGITASNTGTETNSEDLGIIISKSELITTELIEKLNATTGNLEERLTQALGNNQILPEEAGIQINGNRFDFNATNNEKNILPLVFKILK